MSSIKVTASITNVTNVEYQIQVTSDYQGERETPLIDKSIVPKDTLQMGTIQAGSKHSLHFLVIRTNSSQELEYAELYQKQHNGDEISIEIHDNNIQYSGGTTSVIFQPVAPKLL